MQAFLPVMQPSSPGSVTLWITDLKDSGMSTRPAHELWDRLLHICGI